MGLSSNFFILFLKSVFYYIFFVFEPTVPGFPKTFTRLKMMMQSCGGGRGGWGALGRLSGLCAPKCPPSHYEIIPLSISPSPPPSTISHSLSPTQMAVSCPPLSLPLSDDAFPSASLSLAYLFNKPPSFTLKKKDTDRRESKDRCCYLGDVLECRTNQLAARMF